MVRKIIGRCVLYLTFLALPSAMVVGAQGEEDHLRVRNPVKLPARLPAERIAIGSPGDYKPCIARLPSGELLIVAFHQHSPKPGKLREDMLLFRSVDDGRTWTDAETLPLLGREPYFTVLDNGTIFITTHLLAQDVRNKHDYCHSYLHRSADAGKTWQTTKLDRESLSGDEKAGAVGTSRNLLKLKDGTVILGVGTARGTAYPREFLWRSRDDGVSWETGPQFDYELAARGTQLGEVIYWQARNGDILAVCRVNRKLFPPIPDTDIPSGKIDHLNRMVLYRSRDKGATWSFSELGSHYGEMYAALLRLNEGRLLFTFTLRMAVPPNKPPLGVRAVVGRETEEGFDFDFRHDRIAISDKTPVGALSGGGFGPTVQLKDGTLVTAYSYRKADKKTYLEVARWRLE